MRFRKASYSRLLESRLPGRRARAPAATSRMLMDTLLVVDAGARAAYLVIGCGRRAARTWPFISHLVLARFRRLRNATGLVDHRRSDTKNSPLA